MSLRITASQVLEVESGIPLGGMLRYFPEVLGSRA